MAYTPLVPVTSMPAANAAPAGAKDLDTYNMALVCVRVADGGGTGVAALIMRDPGGRWCQVGPSWAVAATQEGRQAARLKLWRDGLRGTLFTILVTGGPTLDDCYLEGLNDGR